jgi:iduronate 2-sulfatase
MKQLAMALTVIAVLCGQGHATEPAKPNVLLIIVDDLTTTLSSQRWPAAKTPHLDKLAARGVRFERAYSQFSLCNPSRASFLTGCYPEKTRVTDLSTSFREALPDVVTLPQHFKNHGCKTAAIGKVFHVPDPHTQHDIVHRAPLALDQAILEEAKQNDPADPPRPGNRGKGRDYNQNYASANRPDSDFTDHQIAQRTLETLDELKDGPFFITTGFIRPHTPFVAPQWCFDAIDRAQIKLPPFHTDAGDEPRYTDKP